MNNNNTTSKKFKDLHTASLFLVDNKTLVKIQPSYTAKGNYKFNAIDTTEGKLYNVLDSFLVLTKITKKKNLDN